ncbi:MAG: hypothetical protein G01um10147_970 [Microgenomates group bacterium Gr01-1014_7]|nr:MAG: hypothetical protein G01um10147_970 [Microgenomates group bacterium Gr01-1014_7]
MNIYQLVTGFLFLLYFLGVLQFGLQKILIQAVPVVLVTTVAGAILDYIELKRLTVPRTPFITGLIIGLISQFGESALKLSAIGAAAMLVKFFIKLDGRHIFNPAASGIFAGMLIFNSQPSWWVGGGSIWPYLIWVPVFLLKFKRWAPMVGFLLPTMLFSGVSILNSSSLLFFLSVMLIEPKTSPGDIKLGLIYGLIVGFSYLILNTQYLILNTLDPLILSLLVGNLGARLLGKFIV